ncbi:hypothetical protein EON82_16155 [bacterium]|nr:MAG: hypothetical protein EON82_16155 [bacterium]
MSFRRTKRGVTLIELLVVITIQVAILGAVTTLLCYTMGQIGHATAGIASLDQASKVMRSLSTTIRESSKNDLITSNGISGLRCTMPTNASDTDGDGVNDVFSASSFGSGGTPDYGSGGQRVWYYFSDSTGAFGTSGTILWRAVRSDNNNPTSADVDRTWSYYYNSTPRFPLVNGLSFSVSASDESTTVTVTASAAEGAPDRSGAGGTSSDAQSVTLSQKIAWRSQFE